MCKSHVTAAVSLLWLCVVNQPLIHGQQPDVAARTAVESWLGLVDSQKYEESWKAAGAVFRNAVSAEKWSEAVRAARTPLGSLKSRTLKVATPTKALPGAPEGEYVVHQFNTSFDKNAAAAEVVTVMREPDGSWRVVGYFVK